MIRGARPAYLCTWTLGNNEFMHYDLDGGVHEFVTAGGDALPETGGTSRVYGKFLAVPCMPGVFIGVADNYGWIVYRAF